MLRALEQLCLYWEVTKLQKGIYIKFVKPRKNRGNLRLGKIRECMLTCLKIRLVADYSPKLSYTQHTKIHFPLGKHNFCVILSDKKYIQKLYNNVSKYKWSYDVKSRKFGILYALNLWKSYKNFARSKKWKLEFLFENIIKVDLKW